MYCIVDLASVTNGRERDIFEVLLQHQPDVRTGTVILLAHDPSVFAEFRAEAITVSDDKTTTEQDRFAIETVDKAIEAAPVDEPILVCSFRLVLQYHLAQKPAGNRQVEFLDFRHLLRLTTSPGTKQLDQWPQSFMPLDEAIRLMKTALTVRGPLMQTQLRPALARQNPAWNKVKGRNAPQDDPKIISLLVREAAAQGAITISGDENNPLLALSGTTAPPRRTGAIQRAAAPTTPTVTAPDIDLLDGSRDSDRYMRALRAAKLGPFSEVRTAVFEQIDKILKERVGEVSIRDLISDAVDDVRSSIEKARAEGRQYLVRSLTRNLPWGALKAFLVILMTRQPIVVTDDGEIVRADWTNLSKKVARLLPDWQIILDSELIVFLIAKGFEINSYSDEELAGALYDSRRSVAKVEQVIAYLLKEGICELSPEYSLRLVRTSGQHSA
ncbi:hypothetical protein A9W99_13700 [Mycobacterium sp. 1164966.3]|uniref:hypothetical protein n=1 Tax=Mycobacterium sp. 1164966.3 TaxID=1856861 RepID=UPI0008014C88|nr:hypothetical protein [Mycobacterium sp. 1164966.3]OBA81768.1 hypothetical protein A9W99_13700 [Mycobacterium sp. 1164966.3]